MPDNAGNLYVPPKNKKAGSGGRLSRKKRSTTDSQQQQQLTVPKILQRPPDRESRATVSSAPSPSAARRRQSSPQTVTPKSLSKTEETKTLSDPAMLPRIQSLTVLSQEGRLLDGMIRKYLVSLQNRSCIGVIGRSSSGKSFVLSQLTRLQQMPGQVSNSVFPTAKTAHVKSFTTKGVELWVTGARHILIDSPPVFSSIASNKWMKPPNRKDWSARDILRLRDLQLATLLVQVCDTLLVVVNGSNVVDQGIIQLLAQARKLADEIPGLTSSQSEKGSCCCRLHIVVNRVNDGKHCDQVVKQRYEEETGISVDHVTTIPIFKSSTSEDVFRFKKIYDIWKTSYKGIQQSQMLGSEKDGLTFDAAVESLRCKLLTFNANTGLETGAWASRLLRTWDSIKRSDVLQRLSSQRYPDFDRGRQPSHW